MITKERVESVLGRVRPFLQADGGDIEVVGVDGNSVDVKLTGMCAGCPSAHMTLYLGVESRAA
jgi:Fe-S cluster biogenesis protein NfuA